MSTILFHLRPLSAPPLSWQLQLEYIRCDRNHTVPRRSDRVPIAPERRWLSVQRNTTMCKIKRPTAMAGQLSPSLSSQAEEALWCIGQPLGGVVKPAPDRITQRIGQWTGELHLTASFTASLQPPIGRRRLKVNLNSFHAPRTLDFA